MQQALLELSNPLDLILGKPFFDGLPKAPGIYKMFGDDGSLLYVGKAKDLHARLMSYRRVKITERSTKTLRLIHQISSIDIELCENEECALVRENELLRDLKPPFNIANIAPETYFYFTVTLEQENGIHQDPVRVDINLVFEPTDKEAAVFGAFKGLARCHRAFFALRRMLWMATHADPKSDYSYPLNLIKRQRLQAHPCTLTKPWLNLLAGFFHGFSYSPLQKEPELTTALRIASLQFTHWDLFHQNWIKEDIDLLVSFYRSGPVRNAQLKRFSDQDASTIEKNRVDDLIVKKRFAKLARN